MNYEVNPFQDYESITIDELKDQATCRFVNDMKLSGQDLIKSRSP